MKPHVVHNSGENEWYTPEKYIVAARNVLGSIDLDPASCEFANNIIKAKTFYSLQNSGLEKDWHGKVWMNPPYGRKIIEQFVSKFIKHYLDRDIIEGIVLVNNASETDWYQSLLINCTGFCMHRGRIRFVSDKGMMKSPLQGQTIFYFGTNLYSFANEFNKFGPICNTQYIFSEIMNTVYHDAGYP